MHEMIGNFISMLKVVLLLTNTGRTTRYEEDHIH